MLDLIGVTAGVEVVADIELLEVLIAVELLVVGVGNRLKACLVFGVQDRFGIAPEVGAGHGDQVGLIAGEQRPDVVAKFIIRVGRNVVKLVHGDKPVVEGFDAIIV